MWVLKKDRDLKATMHERNSTGNTGLNTAHADMFY